ncbi:MAG: iron-containing redox enzyme family protein [Bdellovibrionota bacterium]
MSTELRKIFNDCQEQLKKTAKDFQWQDKKSYGMWLANSYHYALNSTRLLALASGTMPLHLTKISNRFVQHAAEEKGHEKLLENDIKALGFSLNDLPVSSEMKVYYRSLYYWMTPAGEAVGLIGWILSLEGLAAHTGPWLYEQAVKHHGQKAATFLKVHSDADPDHLNKAFEITTLLNDHEMKIVCDSVEMYSEQYIKILESISKGKGSGKQAA